MKKVIEIPYMSSTNDAINFWQNAGYIFKEDFTIARKGEIRYIEPKIQMILAQDAIAFGFKIVEI